MPSNQSKTLGNDDQAFWGMAAMTAAETGLEDLQPVNQGGWHLRKLSLIHKHRDGI
jgi:mannan endo-1,6-alpha-mannosidase